MTQFKDIPLATNQRNVSQNDLRQNMGYLMPAPAIGATGILPVDHLATGDNGASPSDGFHKQLSLLDRTTPSNLQNSVNSQNSDSILYSKLDGANFSQLNFFNNESGVLSNKVITIVKSFGTFTNTGATVGNAYNVTSVTNLGSGHFKIVFTDNLPTANFCPLVTGFSASGTHAAVGTTSSFLISGFDIYFVDAKTGNNLNVTQFSFVVFGIF